MSAAYHVFPLDGFHNRTLDGWREVVRRTEYPASVVPARYNPRSGRRIPAHTVPAGAVVERSQWRATARKHAMTHGQAGVWRADDSFVEFYRDGDQVRQRTYRHAKPESTP